MPTYKADVGQAHKRTIAAELDAAGIEGVFVGTDQIEASGENAERLAQIIAERCPHLDWLRWHPATPTAPVRRGKG